MTVSVAQQGFDIGATIREIRHEQVLTQSELADLAGIHEITVSDLERGKRKASARTVRKLAVAFGFETRDLLKRAKESESGNSAITEKPRRTRAPEETPENSRRIDEVEDRWDEEDAKLEAEDN